MDMVGTCFICKEALIYSLETYAAWMLKGIDLTRDDVHKDISALHL